MNNVPEIRFEGFDGVWEQRKLGEVAEFNPRSILPDSFEYVDLESVFGTSLISHRTENKETAPSRAQRLAKKGDVFFQTVRPYQKNNFLFNLSFDNFVFSTGYAQLRPNIDSNYLLCLLQEEKFVTKVIDNCTGTSYPAINSTTLAGVEVCVTLDTSEQTTIGNFFRTLDEALALCKRKLEGLKELKRGYSQLMFPQAGESVPRVRFAGFAGEWAETKLGEMLTERDEMLEESVEYPLMSFVGNVGVVPKSEQYDRSFLVKGDDKKYKRTEINDFIYSSNNLETGSIGFNKTGKAVISPVYSIFYSNNYSESLFIGLLSKRKDFINKMIHFRQGVMYGQWRIHERDFLNITVLTPSAVEQNKIIHFFRNLDEQIIAQQSKWDKLQQLKAAYLQKMFV